MTCRSYRGFVSDFCNRAFLSSNVAKSLNLSNDFQIRPFVANRRKALAGNPTALVQDPVLHAYSLVQYKTNAENVARIRSHLQAAANASGKTLTPLVYHLRSIILSCRVSAML
jgi:hypothetical protein